MIAANTNAASAGPPGECVKGDDLPAVDPINIPSGTYTLTLDPKYSLNSDSAPATYIYG